ncbi:hypothetical protein BDN72DRAFT_800408 [Pluteus cervinus]|uniref:Uncharacterized protein n=1 Tax=Pluteus cervinus TaxID=181527 RepID=A0ACD3ALE1_9AGAR|nr:hypothetical protein BDN72DRAFT_800408 [Pluteus cervinus]
MTATVCITGSSQFLCKYPAYSTLPFHLPNEVLHHILEELLRHELVPVLRVNKTLYGVATRVLYHSIINLRPPRSIQCLLSMSRNPSLPLLVRTLEIDWQNIVSTANLYSLLHNVLRQTTLLKSLLLDLPKTHHAAPYWILDGCPFSLAHFATSLPCKPPLARFLDTQPEIVDLTLRGFQGTRPSFLPMLDFLLSPLDPLTATGTSSEFALQPNSLPKLTQFRVVHAGPAVISAVVRNRPVEVVSVPLFADSSEEVLDAIALSAKPITRLSIMSFDPQAPEVLLPKVVERFPQLEALHVVILMADYSLEVLEASGGLLSALKSLRYITFMASSGESSRQLSASDERSIAKSWHECCPTLKTIILPRGRVWFEGGTGWDCADDDEDEL